VFENQYQNVKRVGDVLAAGLGLVATLPLTVPVAMALFVQNGGDVFFSQERVGQGQKPFNIYKFKTMRNPTNNQGHTIPDAQRVTPLGGFLRKHSIDELPQLWNILTGDMSVIGPRPWRQKILVSRAAERSDEYNYYFKKRHDVKCGLCCAFDLNYGRLASAILEQEHNTRYIEFIQSKEKTIPQKMWYELGLIAQAAFVAIKGRHDASQFEPTKPTQNPA
jgi:lipopolysaccharide/colanic/teichoic acid biosynthesis glycosyltransferase